MSDRLTINASTDLVIEVEKGNVVAIRVLDSLYANINIAIVDFDQSTSHEGISHVNVDSIVNDFDQYNMDVGEKFVDFEDDED